MLEHCRIFGYTLFSYYLFAYKKMKKFIIFINVLIPLVIGFVFYLFFRPNSYVSLFARKLINITPVIVRPELNHHWLIMFLNNHMADFLWAYSFTFTIYLFLEIEQIKNHYLICISFVAIIELLQLVPFLPGIFDIIDIIIEIIAVVIAIHFIYPSRRTNEYGKK